MIAAKQAKRIRFNPIRGRKSQNFMRRENYLRKELYERIASDPAIFDFIQRGSLDGLWYWDVENPEQEWMNSRFWELLGYDPREKKHLASEWQDLIHPDDLKKSLENFQKHLDDPNHPYDQIVRYRHKSGRTIWVRCRGIAIRDENGKPIRMLGAHNDLTEMKELEAQLRQMADTDQMTDMPNRRAFNTHFEWAFKNQKRTAEPLSLALIDIDHFKLINDIYGHQIGDKTLLAVSSAIRNSCRDNDFAARWGGEEFIVLLHSTDRAPAIMIAERIKASIAEIDTVPEKLTASIGVTTITQPAMDTGMQLLDLMVAEADRALYFAKSSGRDRVVHASPLQAA